MTKELRWVKCGNGSDWCDLKNLDPSRDAVKVHGVYCIWRWFDEDAPEPDTIYVSSGNIPQRLSEHQNNPEIIKFGESLVTWAEVPDHHQRGVERYLHDLLKPQLGEAPDADIIEVNTPFD